MKEGALAALVERLQQHEVPTALADVRDRALAEIVAQLQQVHVPATVSRVTAEALTEARGAMLKDRLGARAELDAMSHRFTSIEEILHTISQWLEGVEQHNAALSAELRSELGELRAGLETTRRVHASSSAPGMAAGGPGLFLASGPYGRFLVRHPDVVGDAIIRGEFWDPHLKDAIEAHADPSKTAIDAGPYVGFHSVFLSRHFAHVHAFEPQSRVFDLLRTNIELNGCRNVEAVQSGLYSHPCWVALAPDDMQEIPIQRIDGAIDYAAIGNAAALTFVASDEPVQDAVRAVTIDSLDLDSVGFMKVDTQGADFHVLRGATETIRRCRPVIAFEFERLLSAAHGVEWGAYERFFVEADYTLAVLSQSADGKQTDYLARPA